MLETFVPIAGHEKHYRVSNYGRVMAITGGFLKPQANNHGYLYVYLKHGGRGKAYIHRLVAEAFVPNSDPIINTVVNHKDFNPRNNCADNLEWTTAKGNVHHSLQAGRYERTDEWLAHLRKTNEKNGRAVAGRDVFTGEEITFKCLNDCREAGFQPSCVCNCCQGKRRSHKGYTWRYVDA